MAGNWFRNSKAVAYTALTLIILAAVACGSASAPADTAPAVPAAEQAAVPAPDKAAASAPAASASVAPTAIPKTMTEPAEAPAEVNPGKLTVMVGDLGNERFDQTFVGGTPGFGNYGSIVHGTLITSSEERSVIPGIATEWGLSADGLAWTFTLREGVKFHDGSELTPEDVLWTLEHSFGHEAPEYSVSTTAARVASDLQSIELGGPNQVVVVTKAIRLDIPQQLADNDPGYFPPMPKRDKLHDPEVEAAYDLNPIGTGFMSLASHNKASMMGFERFDDFYYQPKYGLPEDKRVSFQSLDLFLVPEEATRVAAIRAGEADIAPISMQSKKAVEDGDGRLVFAQEAVISQPGLQGCWEPQYPCHDIRVRQALDLAINKELIRDTLYGGPEVFEIKGWKTVTPSTIGYTPEMDPWPADPDKARQLLADAGYPGGEGFGKFIINVRKGTALPLMIETAQLVGDMWNKELGLEVEVRVLESQDSKRRRYAGELHGQVYWEENDTRVDASSQANSYGDPENKSRWHGDPELHRMGREAFLMLDPDERAEALAKLYQRYREESYHLGIGYANTPWAVGPRVLTWQPYPLTLFPSALHKLTLK
jgi:ABC-type transport system substrate-binding protein